MFNSDIPTKAELPTSRQLIKSTIIAALAAALILVTIVLPSEYAIDPTGAGRVLGLTQMGEIKTQLADEAEADRLRSEGAQPQSSLMRHIIGVFGISSAHAQEMRSDEMSVTLDPGTAAEIKLTMVKGATATFTWTSTGDGVNFDMHGDGKGTSTSYEKGRAQKSQEGTIEAAFDGSHGWFWRNRTGEKVTVTLKTQGAYTQIKRVM